MSSPLLPAEHASQLAEFGEPVAAFRASKFNLLLLLVFTIGAVFLGILFSLLWLYLIVLTFTDPAFAASRTELFVLHLVWFALLYLIARTRRPGLTRLLHLGHSVGFGLLPLLTSATGWRRMRQTWGLRVLVFPAGLARIQGETADVVLWEEITTVKRAVMSDQEQESALSGAIRLTLVTSDGREFEFDETLSRLREMRRHIERFTLSHLLHSALDAYDAGSDIDFGKLRANREGLSNDGFCLPWPFCESVKVTNGKVLVKRLDVRHPVRRIPLREVPNVHVLIALAEYVRKYAP